MSRRSRERANARPWEQPDDEQHTGDASDGCGDQRNSPCEHPKKQLKHFTYGYRWRCDDCAATGEEWWD